MRTGIGRRLAFGRAVIAPAALAQAYPFAPRAGNRPGPDVRPDPLSSLAGVMLAGHSRRQGWLVVLDQHQGC
jgi:hypothetical protein